MDAPGQTSQSKLAQPRGQVRRLGPGAWLWSRCLALVVTTLVALLRLTWRMRIEGQPGSGAALLAYYHGQQLSLTRLRLPRPVTLLVSRSRDGEWAACVARWLGHLVLRGSSSRGAVAAARGLIRVLRRGGKVGIAVDGPRGPRRRVQGDPHRLARQAGAPVVPVAAACSRGAVLGSWDRLVVPAPFARVVVVFGPPAAPGGLPAALERAEQRAQRLLIRDGG